MVAFVRKLIIAVTLIFGFIFVFSNFGKILDLAEGTLYWYGVAFGWITAISIYLFSKSKGYSYPTDIESLMLRMCSLFMGSAGFLFTASSLIELQIVAPNFLQSSIPPIIACIFIVIPSLGNPKSEISTTRELGEPISEK